MIRTYLRHRSALLLLYLLTVVSFPGIQALYGVDMTPVWYALSIITFFLVIFLAVDGYRFILRVRTLDQIMENLSEAEHALPSAGGPLEMRYQALLRALYLLLDEQAERLTRQHGDQLDYYTLWMHQIKTPIAAMRLALQSGANADVLEAELFKVERYVEMALQYVKIQDLSSDLVLREYPLAPIVSASVKKYASLFIGKRLKVEIEPIEGAVLTDSKWLSFILEQILSNAVKYTQKGGVRIRQAGNALTIEDSGIGIRPEDLSRIFEKGYTGYNGRMNQRASGLGLYMSRRVARQLNIRIYPESTLHQGTSMTLVFPKRDETIL